MPIESILSELKEERQRQDAKFGEQNLPNGTGYGTLGDYVQLCGTTADGARDYCDRGYQTGNLVYADILYEEFAEAMEERDPSRLREELKQVAAVCIKWMEKIDRETK